jgi:hypothetical protein
MPQVPHTVLGVSSPAQAVPSWSTCRGTISQGLEQNGVDRIKEQVDVALTATTPNITHVCFDSKHPNSSKYTLL